MRNSGHHLTLHPGVKLPNGWISPMELIAWKENYQEQCWGFCLGNINSSIQIKATATSLSQIWPNLNKIEFWANQFLSLALALSFQMMPTASKWKCWSPIITWSVSSRGRQPETLSKEKRDVVYLEHNQGFYGVTHQETAWHSLNPKRDMNMQPHGKWTSINLTTQLARRYKNNHLPWSEDIQKNEAYCKK